MQLPFDCRLPAIRKQAYYVPMKRLAAVALMVVVGLALPVCAQRPAAHGGFHGRSAPGFHSGFHAPVSRGFGAPASRGFGAPNINRQAGLLRYPGGRPLAMARGSRSGDGNSGGRRNGPERGRHRRPYVSPYGAGIFYGYPGYGVSSVIDPYPLDYADTFDTDDSTASTPEQTAVEPGQTAEGSAGEYEGPPEQPWQPPRIPYQPSAAPAQLAPTPESEQAVTLIFKDGRQPEQIHNYVLTRSTVFVQDNQRREIPTDQLDLAATAKANQDAGVDFSLPGAAQ